ncbi:MAG: tetratricopeptide repeat protein, partial [Chloroflexales bacterium]|nr:tetratricopeptide repeat protein [Chloroflexales bacterium]
YGGGIIKFGSDTLTAFFDATRLGGRHALLAGHAALALHAHLAAAPAPQGAAGVTTQPRVALHSGSLFMAEVGDARHTELVVTGRALNRVVSALQSAAPGEVVVTDAALHLLEGAQTQQKAPDLYRVQRLPPIPILPAQPLPPVLPDPPTWDTITLLLSRIAVFQPYVPAGLSQRVAQSHGGEFRSVTALFANFYVFRTLLTLLELVGVVEGDMSIVGQVLQAYYATTQDVVHRYGGSINRVDMAPDGNRTLVFFGAPVAHEDDPLRAVQAGLALREALPATNQAISALLREWFATHATGPALPQVAMATLRQRVGIASGVVFAGIVGTPQRHEYVLLGDTVDLAARLLAVANDNDVFIASRTYRAVRHAVQAEERPPIVRPGFPHPVAAFRVLEKRAEADAAATRVVAAPLVGRHEEYAQLMGAAQRALAGSPGGGVVALVGEPGIGKSRLLDELLAALLQQVAALEALHTQCRSYEQTEAYAPVARLLCQALRIDRAAPAALQAARVHEVLQSMLPDWCRFAPLLQPLLGVSLPDSELTAALSAEQRRERLHDLLTQLWRALARQHPLALAVDDLQWADASSREVIQRLAVEAVGQPLLLLLSYRPDAAKEEPWQNLEHATSLTLRPLAEADSAQLVQTLLGGDAPDEIKPFVQRSGGTPFFLEETVRYLIGAGMIRRTSGGVWQAQPIHDAAAIPADIEHMIGARLDQLDAATRALLQQAAVIGQQFDRNVLVAVVTDQSQLDQQLAALIAASFVERADGGDNDYHFRHALMRDVAYNTMLFAQRRELHARVAAAIAQGDATGQHVVLANHYRAAERPDQAFPHFIAAAQQAAQRFANHEALALYEQALANAPWRQAPDSPPDLAAAATVFAALGDVLALLSEYGRAQETYGWLLHLYEQRDAAAYALQRAALQRKLGATHESQGALDQALEWFGKAAETLGQAPSSGECALEQARVLSDTGWIFFRRQDLDQAQQYLEQALSTIAPLLNDQEEANILNRLGGVAWTHGDMQQAQHYVQRSMEASERSGDLMAQSSALANLGLLTESQGLLTDAIHYGRQALDIVRLIGNRRMVALVTLNLGWVYYNLENYQQAHAHFTKAYTYASEVRDSYHQMQTLLGLGRVFHELGDDVAAERAVMQSQFIAAQLQLPAQQVEGIVLVAEIALQQNKQATAQQLYEEARAIVSELESEEYGKLQRLEARIAFAQGDQTRALALLAKAEGLFATLHNTPEVRRTAQLRAQFAVAEPASHEQ